MKTAHIVFGESGEYEDRRQWIVAVYPGEEDAMQHQEAAQKAADDFYRLDVSLRDSRSTARNANPFDPLFTGFWSTGTKYSVKPVQVTQSFQQAQKAARVREVLIQANQGESAELNKTPSTSCSL